MADIVTEVRQALQDIVAPELRDLTAKLGIVHERIDTLRLEVIAVNERLKALNAGLDATKERFEHYFRALKLLIENASMRGDIEAVREISDLRDRLRRVEAALHRTA